MKTPEHEKALDAILIICLRTIDIQRHHGEKRQHLDYPWKIKEKVARRLVDLHNAMLQRD